MRSKAILTGTLALAGVLLTRPSTAVVNDLTDQFKAGAHVGEVAQLGVDLQFSGASGSTTTNAQGIFYSFYGITLSEPKVYPPNYWGTVPLYFFGQNVGATVTLSNFGPRAVEKLRVTTQVYVLNTDGSSGVKLAADRVTDFWVNKGETKVVDASFTPLFVPGADSGLDRVLIMVQHPNEGGGAGNANPALIMVKEAVLCPPAIEAKAKAGK